MFYTGEMHNGKAYLVESGRGLRMPSLKAAKAEAVARNAAGLRAIGESLCRSFARMQQAAELKAARKARDARNAAASPSFL